MAALTTTLYTAAMLAARNLRMKYVAITWQLLHSLSQQNINLQSRNVTQTKGTSRGFGFNFGLESSGYEVLEV